MVAWVFERVNGVRRFVSRSVHCVGQSGQHAGAVT